MRKLLSVLLIVLIVCSGCIYIQAPTSEESESAASEKTTSTRSAGQTSQQPETQQSSQQPDSQPDAPSNESDTSLNPSSYGIDGYCIVHLPDGAVIYDPTYDFPNRWDYWINNLAVEPEALYFTEGGVHVDSDPEYDGEYMLVRIDGDGGGRVVLHTMEAVDYLQLMPYGDKIFFVADGWDSVEIGWAYRDGSGSGWLDLSDYAEAYNAYTDWLGAAYLFTEGDTLYAVIQLSGYDFSAEHTISIGSDLSVHHVSG